MVNRPSSVRLEAAATVHARLCFMLWATGVRFSGKYAGFVGFFTAQREIVVWIKQCKQPKFHDCG